MKLYSLRWILAFCMIVAVSPATFQSLAEAPVLENKVANLVLRRANPTKKPNAETIVVSQKELNDYLVEYIQRNKPRGLRKMVVDLLPNNSFAARAFVNGDDIEIKVQGLAGTMLRSMLKGDQLLEAEGSVEMIGSKLKYNLDKMRVNGVRFPSDTAMELVAYFLKEKQGGGQYANPIELQPYGISKLSIDQGRVVILEQ